MLTHYHRALKKTRAMDNPLGRRRENRVSSCLACGSVLGIYVEGEVPQHEAHDCAFEREPVNFYDLADCLAEQRATRKPEE